MARVFLFNPPHPEGKGFTREGRCTQESGIWGTQWPPISLVTTASILEEDGHRLKVVDFPAKGLGRVHLERILRSFQPEFVFWNAATPTLDADLQTARLIKRISGEMITGVLGTHVTALPGTALQHPNLDVVVRGEPEQTIRELCARRDWEAVRGISYKDSETGAVRYNPDRSFLAPGQIPSPAWRFLDLGPYRLPLKGRPFLTVAPIRGCSFSCSFCTAQLYYGKGLRRRPVERVVDEIEEGISDFGVRDFFVWADTFSADKAYVKRFSREIAARGLKISWTCNSRVDQVDEEMLWPMKRAGLWMISFGLESGNEEVLKRTGKNITMEQSRTAVRLAHRLGIKTSGHFILGLPGETSASMEETLRFSLDLPLDIAQFYAAAPFPGTALYARARTEGWLRADASFSQGLAGMDLPGLPAQKVDAFRRYAYRRFYARPRAIKKIYAMVEPGAVGSVFRDVARFMGWAR